jgi:hypothetical protein
MDLMPRFKSAAENYGINYQPAKLKTTLTTLADETSFRKRNAAGQPDQGQYAAELAKKAHYTQVFNCPAQCHSCGNSQVRYPLFRTSQGTCAKFCSAGACSDTGVGTDCRKCAGIYSIGNIKVVPTPISDALAGGQSLPNSNAKDPRDMTDAENHGTGGAVTDGDIDQSANGNPDGANPETPTLSNPVMRNPDNSAEAGIDTGGSSPGGQVGIPGTGIPGVPGTGGGIPGTSGGKNGSEDGKGMNSAAVALTVMMVVFFLGGLGALGYMYFAGKGPFASSARGGSGRSTTSRIPHAYSNELQMTRRVAASRGNIITADVDPIPEVDENNEYKDSVV